MLVSYTHKFIFIKTTKTAGTSTEIFFERFCRPDIENIDHGSDERVTEVGIVGFRGNQKALPVQPTFIGHMSAEEVKKLLDPAIWDSYLKFCNVRNPYDQVVSLFWHAMRLEKRDDIGEASESEIVDTFRDWVMQARHGNRSRAITFIDGAFALDDVIRYERLEEDIRRICGLIGAEFDQLGAYKTRIRKNKLPFHYYYDQTCADHVYKHYEVSFETFGYERASWKV